MASENRCSTLVRLVCLASLLHAGACITCRSCRGSDGSNCHLQPHLETGVTACGSDKTECAVFVQFQADKNSEGKVHDIVRGCPATMMPPGMIRNGCKTDNAHYIECTKYCEGVDLCNQNLTIAAGEWNEGGGSNSGRNGAGVILPFYTLSSICVLVQLLALLAGDC